MNCPKKRLCLRFLLPLRCSLRTSGKNLTPEQFLSIQAKAPKTTDNPSVDISKVLGSAFTGAEDFSNVNINNCDFSKVSSITGAQIASSKGFWASASGALPGVNLSTKQYADFLPILQGAIAEGETKTIRVTDALKSITLAGLILLTSKYHNFYELHAAISAFSNGSEERDLHIFEPIQQSYYTLRYSLPVKRTCRPEGNPLPICSYVYLMSAVAEVLFGIELPQPEKKVTMRQYLALLHETCKRKESEREAV